MLFVMPQEPEEPPDNGHDQCDGLSRMANSEESRVSNSTRSAQTTLAVLMMAIGAAAVNAAAHEADPALESYAVADDAIEGGIAGLCGDGSCFAAHSTPGCNIFICCAAVCDQDPFCCEVEWDNFCVGTANIVCASCGGAGSGSCYFPDATPACNNAICCNLVCSQDPFCCDVEWDNFCAAAASNMCTCGGLSTGSCFTVHPSPWCNDAQCCNAVCGFDPFCCDTQWDSTCVEVANEICTCSGVWAGNCFKVHANPWCNRAACCTEVCAMDPFCCDTQWDNFCVGEAYQFCCPADLSPAPLGSGVVDIDDLLLVIANWGTCAFPGDCNADIFPNGGNSQVTIDDLLFIIGRWGPCQ
jgi:hypothetical protein